MRDRIGEGREGRKLECCSVCVSWLCGLCLSSFVSYTANTCNITLRMNPIIRYVILQQNRTPKPPTDFQGDIRRMNNTFWAMHRCQTARHKTREDLLPDPSIVPDVEFWKRCFRRELTLGEDQVRKMDSF